MNIFNHQTSFRRVLLAGAGLSAMVMSGMTASAQTAEDAIEDEVTVTGTRAIIQDAIALKQQSTQIVDGLSADEIGDLPALSIGEALETVTGVASHRENGGATEVSIRGLGPFLSSTVVNGREATNGSGDRSVNFSQFPSELMNKLAVFKTQDASQIEGGVAGQIQLETLKPLDYNKQRFQFNLKGNVNPDQLNQEDTLAGDIGYRFTASYVDQFETGAGDIGISIGGQLSDISQPEAESRQTSSTSSSRAACAISNGNFATLLNGSGEDVTGFSNNPDRDDDCDDVNVDRDLGTVPSGFDIDVEGIDTQLLNGVAVDSGIPFAFAPSQRHYRQNDTHDVRDSLFGAIQWQPNDMLDLNADFQWSERTQSEIRNDLTFNGGRRNDTSLNIGTWTNTTTLDSLVVTDSGSIIESVTDNSIEVQGGDYERKETYLGGGISAAYQVSDKLNLSADLSFSETQRDENAIEFRFQSDVTPVIAFNDRGDVPVYTLSDEVFDVTDHDFFVDRLRVRIDNDLERRNTATAARFDAEYETDLGFLTSVQGGLRVSSLEYFALDGGDGGDPGRIEFEFRNDRTETDRNFDATIATSGDSVGLLAAANAGCRTTFNESDFLSSLRDGDLVTNIDDDGNVISSASSWATFNARCLAQMGADHINEFGLAVDADGNPVQIGIGLPQLVEQSADTIDLTEDTISLYAMANYEGEFASRPVRGNFGLRVVNTSVESIGYRTGYDITADAAGILTIASTGDTVQVSADHEYTEFLPSANAIIDLDDQSLVRFGAFRALSRADPADMGFSRNLQTQNQDDDGEDITDPDNLIAGVIASGNPEIQPLTSWNFDAGYEIYPDDDSIFAVSVYYKQFAGGFENVVQNETLTVDGQVVNVPVTIQQTNEETSSLYGVEVTGAHRFSYLPGLWSGLGVKASYNFADSDFEFEDSRYGDQFIREANGTLTQVAEGIIAPGNIPGLSKHVFSGQVYYQIGDLDLQGIYKYRSRYFQPFTTDGTRLRFIGNVGVLEACASYKLNDNYKLSVEAINLLDAPKEQFAYVRDDRYEINQYGPRIFFGIRGKF